MQCVSPTEPIRSATVIDCNVAESTPQLVCRSRARSTGNAISHEYTSRLPDDARLETDRVQNIAPGGVMARRQRLEVGVETFARVGWHPDRQSSNHQTVAIDILPRMHY